MLTQVEVGIGYGGRNADRIRRCIFNCKGQKTPGVTDFTLDAANIANVFKNFLVSQAQIQYIKFTRLAATDVEVLPPDSYQRVDMAVNGTHMLVNGIDAAIEETVAVFVGDAKKGRNARYKIPYAYRETEAQADGQLDPAYAGSGEIEYAQTATQFYNALVTAGLQPVIPGREGNFDTTAKAITTFRYDGIRLYQVTKNRTTLKAKERNLIDSQLNSWNAVYKKALKRAENANQAVDTTLTNEIKADYIKLKAKFGALPVLNAGVPYPLNTLVGVAAED